MIPSQVYASTPEDKDVTVKDIQKKLKEKYPTVDIDLVFGEDTAYDTGRKLSVEFLQRSGFRKVPQVKEKKLCCFGIFKFQALDETKQDIVCL